MARPLCIPRLLLVLPIMFVLSSVSAERYKYLTYSQLHLRLKQLAAEYPNLVRLYSAQERFSLPHVGNCTEQETATATPTRAPCTIWVVELTNFDTLAADASRPELLISGLLHGNEVVGPHVALAYLEYMTAHYDHDDFVRRMVDTRHVTVVPMTNAVGFFRGEREEMQGITKIDPNRDFGFDQLPDKCMRTVAGRALNELFRAHLFRLLVTFHGGTNVVGYEWGDTSHCDGNLCKPAPDTLIMKALGERMSDNAGMAGPYEAKYPVGDMGKTVYSVSGGLEDWAYGASWAKEATACKPTNLGGYPPDRTRIERSNKRCVTYLVETSRDKQPDEFHLGSDEDILTRGATGDGHVPRNVRLLLSVVDAAEPYVLIDPNASLDQNKRPIVSWTVSGAFFVDATAVQWSTMGGVHSGLSTIDTGTAGLPIAGGNGTRFTHRLPDYFPSMSTPLFFRVVTVVDSTFSRQPEGSSPDVTPQSHLMGTRASNKWKFANGKQKLQGSRVFFSETIRVGLSAPHVFTRSTVLDPEWRTSQAEGKLLSPSDDDLYKLLISDAEPVKPTGRSIVMPVIGGILAILAVSIAMYICVRRRRRRKTSNDAAAFTIGEEEDEERRALTPPDGVDLDDFEGADHVVAASGVKNPDAVSYVKRDKEHTVLQVTTGTKGT